MTEQEYKEMTLVTDKRIKFIAEQLKKGGSK